MALLNDDATVELVGGVKAARDAAKGLVEGQIVRGKSRLHSSDKTRKSMHTRQRIMDAARQIMIERGSTNFQMSEVSERCNMSKGSLYYYYADKDELLEAIFNEAVDSLVDEVESVAARAPSARDALRGLYAEFASRLRRGSVLALAMTYGLAGGNEGSFAEMTSRLSRAAEVIAAQLERAKGEGVVRPDVDSALTSVFATGGFLATSMVFAGGMMADDPDEVVARITDMTLKGVGVEGVSLE